MPRSAGRVVATGSQDISHRIIQQGLSKGIMDPGKGIHIKGTHQVWPQSYGQAIIAHELPHRLVSHGTLH